MSSLLEKAIVDATALKETALKNAESIVIEKYAEEVKAAVNVLLEQEVPEVPGAEMEMDPEGGLADMGMPGEMPVDDDPAAAGEEDMAPPMEEGEDEKLNSLIKEFPDSFLAEDEDKPIFINLEQLHAEIYPTKRAEPADLEEDEGGIEFPEADAAQETLNIGGEEEEVEPGMRDIYESLLSGSELDYLTDEVLGELQGIPEPTKRGWEGVTAADLEEIEALEALQPDEDDDEEDESASLAQEEIGNLKKEIKNLEKAGLEVKTENKKFRNALLTLKDKLEQTNVSNAKLLYINQTLSNASLNERQKDKIVEAISKSESVKEAKVIYETLQSSVGLTVGRGPESLNEAVSNRRPSFTVSRGVSRRETEKQMSPMYDRLQRLAGITNK